MKWHPYLLFKLYNIAHGGIYIHIHTYMYQTAPKHVPKTYTKTSTQLVNKEGHIARI